MFLRLFPRLYAAWTNYGKFFIHLFVLLLQKVMLPLKTGFLIRALSGQSSGPRLTVVPI